MLAFSLFSVGIGATVSYVVAYIYQYQRQMPSKNHFDREAEKQSLQNTKKRHIPSDYVFTPIKIRGLELRNRVIKSATFESASKCGKVTNELIDFHRHQAENAAMVTVSYGCISYEGRTFENQLLLYKANKDGLKKLTKTIHERTNAAISIQLTHAGLMAEAIYDSYTAKHGDNKSPIFSASNLWSWSAFSFATEMNIKQIKFIIKRFALSALLCKQCGFDAVTIHCGHGYLISQFLSCITNKRTDEYGAQSIESRSKFAVEIVSKVREFVGDEFPIFIKINSHDGVDKDGVTVNESIQFCRLLVRAGADVVIPTTGFILKNGIFMMRGEVPIIKMCTQSVSWIKKIGIGLVGPFLIPTVKFRPMFLYETSVKLLDGLTGLESNQKPMVCYLGGVTSLKDMNAAFESGFEIISLGRALLREPNFLDKIKYNKDHVSPCDHRNRCIIGQMSGQPLRCYNRTKQKLSKL